MDFLKREKLKKTEQPGFIHPMLATLTDDYFDDPGWIYERKLDGIRCIVVYKDGRPTLYSRNEKKLNDSYPELEEALEGIAEKNFIADGEIVAFDGSVTSFSKLQNRIQVKDRKKAVKLLPKVFLYLFDLIYFDQYDLNDLPLRKRKTILKKALEWNNRIRYTVHRNEKGKDFLEEACNKDWEGLIAKDANSRYITSRSQSWVKFKCSASQELVIGGFTTPQGERKGFGALLVGYYDDSHFLYAGKVGTGYGDKFLEKWRKKLDAISRKTSPFDNFKDDKGGSNHWVQPDYVAEIGFTEWTGSNKLRHPRFLGIRTDKKARDVVKEAR